MAAWTDVAVLLFRGVAESSLRQFTVRSSRRRSTVTKSGDTLVGLTSSRVMKLATHQGVSLSQ